MPRRFITVTPQEPEPVSVSVYFVKFIDLCTTLLLALVFLLVLHIIVLMYTLITKVLCDQFKFRLCKPLI